jgi:hypothetical protein
MKTKTAKPFITLLIGFTFFVSSCVDKGRSGFPRIKDFSKSTGATSEFCTQFINDTDVINGDSSVCLDTCAEGFHLGEQTELDSLNTEISSSSASEETKTFLSDMIAAAAGICFVDEVLRPTGEIFIKRDFCSCINGRPDIINNCDSFCASKTDSTPVLFGSVTLGPAIELNNELQDLNGWCKNEITGSNQTAPACVLEVWDGSAIQSLNITTNAGSNSFTANIANLPLNTTFVAKIKESSSGAVSNEFQIRRIEQETGDGGGTTTPLKIMPVSQYTCINRTGTCGALSDPDEIFLCGFREYYYFPSNSTPLSLPPGSHFLLCHDTQFGIDDSPLFPRLELIPQHFSVWSQSDIRFADQDQDGSPDINKMIQDRLLSEYNVQRTINIFGLFNWPNRPAVDNTSPTAPNVGFYMQPWIDGITGRGFCPTQINYNSTDPTFRILKETVGVDTEGIYLAVKQPDASSTTSQGPGLMIIRENLLKQIWFYYENGQHFVPDEVTSTQKTIMYYWPPDPVDPYVKKSTQKIYIVRAPEEISGNGSTTGLATIIRPPDKRFGCVPSLD